MALLTLTTARGYGSWTGRRNIGGSVKARSAHRVMLVHLVICNMRSGRRAIDRRRQVTASSRASGPLNRPMNYLLRPDFALCVLVVVRPDSGVAGRDRRL